MMKEALVNIFVLDILALIALVKAMISNSGNLLVFAIFFAALSVVVAVRGRT